MSAPATAAPAASARSNRLDAVRGGWFAPLLIGAVAAVVLWFRLPASARDVFWAEDAMEFLQKQIDLGLGHTLFLPYMGYLQFVPRLAAAVVALLPTSYWALGATAVAVLITGGACATVYLVTADTVPWHPARIAIAVTPALIPLGTWEVAGTLNNLHSVLLCAVPWILLHRPATRRGALALALIVCAIVLSEPQAGYFLPLLVWQLRDARRWVVRAGFLVGLAAQVVAFTTSPRDIPTHGLIHPRSTVVGFFANTVLGTAFSSPAQVGHTMAHHAALVFALAVPIAAAVVAGIVFGTGQQRWAMVALASGSAVLWTIGYSWNLAAMVYPFGTFTPERWLHLDTILRYAFAPAVLLVALFLLAAAVLARRRGLRLVGWVVLVAVAAVVVSGAIVTPASQRSLGPDWRSQVASAQTRCAAQPDSATVTLGAMPHGWHVVVPCGRLR
ncbi:MAG: hypothetical protein FWD85_04395 [Microbacteriaceae bacterium]|nr:hypothetical protein [Microbacteriaceae bacterium]MCL2794529.1 hypothetical protein [Microbacteriaceae bacterium]